MLYIGADHRGYNLKEKIKEYLTSQNMPFEDLGALRYEEDDDYPDFSALVAEKVAEKPEENRGILLCGSGAGVCIAANKFKNIRAALAYNLEMAKAMRNDDDVNILCLASDYIDAKNAAAIISIWLATHFSGEQRYSRRIQKIANLELK